MANKEHLEILKQGVEVWNEWRKNHPEAHPDFGISDLSGEHLHGANLSRAILMNADLSGTDLRKANLNKAKLGGADLIKVKLEAAILTEADLSFVNLAGADLRNADLFLANFTGATLRNANFSHCELGFTVFGDTDLSEVRGLNDARHSFPSMITIDTIYQSRGKIPEVFLRGCGVPEDFITYMHSLTASGKPIQFYSCFISYSSKNQIFADRLYADLQNKGVRCWLASEDLKIGDRIRIGIDESIRIHDKLLLVLSKNSVASDWVEQEVETALDRERKEKRTILFPIRLDDTVMKIDSGWPALIKNTRNIGDFRKWRNPEAYQKAFDRLLRDLKAEERTTP